MEAVAALKRHDDGTKRFIDARHELLPLVFAEMELCYHMTAARQADGPEEARSVRELLVEAWASGTFAEVRALLAGKYGEFSAEAHLFAGKDAHYTSGQDYQDKIYSVLDADLAEALVTGGTSPLKAALETLRALRDTCLLYTSVRRALSVISCTSALLAGSSTQVMAARRASGSFSTTKAVWPGTT